MPSHGDRTQVSMLWVWYHALFNPSQAAWGGGYYNNFLHSVIFPIFHLRQNNGYIVHIWQVLPQLSCGDTCRMWKWFELSNWYLCKIKKIPYREIDQRSFSNPHPWSGAEAGTFQDKYINTMAADDLVTHQQSWFSWYRIDRPFYSMTKDVNHLCHVSVKKWWLNVSQNISAHKGLKFAVTAWYLVV